MSEPLSGEVPAYNRALADAIKRWADRVETRRRDHSTAGPLDPQFLAGVRHVAELIDTGYSEIPGDLTFPDDRPDICTPCLEDHHDACPGCKCNSTYHRTAAKVDVIEADGIHLYWSTHCRHGNHEACAATTINGGPRRPAQCKTCGAPCRCPDCPAHGASRAEQEAR